MSTLPLIHEFQPAPSVPHAFRALAALPGIVLFDSSRSGTALGRYSFLSADPCESFCLKRPLPGVDPFAQVAPRMTELRARTIPDLPPFQGGAAGFLAYELAQCFERLPIARWNEFDLPACSIGLYDWVLAWDHARERCWFIGQGFPETSGGLRARRAQARLDTVRKLLCGERSLSHQTVPSETLRIETPSFPVPEMPGIRSNFDPAGYRQAVQRVIDYILAGDIFQANLSQRLLTPARLDPVTQYLALREHNPAPFAAYYARGDWAILSSSPERFLQVKNGEVATRPIKGTRRRRSIPEADLYTRDELRESDKDRAENVMIVDLLRNDLSRVCLPGTIDVPELCEVEVYETVTHLVSEVRGQLRPDASFWDLLRATFPGGSITGAPKIRAMEIITELEQVARGAYCGSLFYCGFDGTADSNILIRTMTQRGGWLALPAGGGVVAQSDPEQEYQETLHKAQGMVNALSPESSAQDKAAAR